MKTRVEGGTDGVFIPDWKVAPVFATCDANNRNVLSTGRVIALPTLLQYFQVVIHTRFRHLLKMAYELVWCIPVLWPICTTNDSID